MAAEASRSLDLALPELVLIESCLSPTEMANREERFAAAAPDRDMCLKVAAALLEASEREARIAVSFGESELWILRERVDIYASQGTNNRLGLDIKQKVYQALLSITNERAAGAFFAGVPTAAVVAPERISGEEMNDALRRWKEFGDAEPEEFGPPSKGRTRGKRKKSPGKDRPQGRPE